MLSEKPKKIGLALGGGAARGGAHIGILAALIKYQIPISFISGTSIGSIIGGLYAAGLSVDKLIAIADHLSWLTLTHFETSLKGMLSSQPIESLINKNIGNITFKELAIPFSASVTDILTGKPVILNSDNLSIAKAIRASSSFPGIYAPTKINNRLYADGGSTDNLPVKAVKTLGADVVIAIDIIPRTILKQIPKHFIQIADRNLDLLLIQASEIARKKADLVLTPVTEQIDSFDIKAYKKLIRMGEMAVEKNLAKITNLL